MPRGVGITHSLTHSRTSLSSLLIGLLRSSPAHGGRGGRDGGAPPPSLPSSPSSPSSPSFVPKRHPPLDLELMTATDLEPMMATSNRDAELGTRVLARVVRVVRVLARVARVAGSPVGQAVAQVACSARSAATKNRGLNSGPLNSGLNSGPLSSNSGTAVAIALALEPAGL